MREIMCMTYPSFRLRSRCGYIGDRCNLDRGRAQRTRCRPFLETAVEDLTTGATSQERREARTAASGSCPSCDRSAATILILRRRLLVSGTLLVVPRSVAVLAHHYILRLSSALHVAQRSDISRVEPVVGYDEIAPG